MKNQVCKILGENIKKIRKKRGLSQSNLADLVGMEIKSLSLIETGNGFASAKTIEKLSNTLNVSVASLFEDYSQNDTNIIYQTILDNVELIKGNYEKLNALNIILKSLI